MKVTVLRVEFSQEIGPNAIETLTNWVMTLAAGLGIMAVVQSTVDDIEIPEEMRHADDNEN